MAFGKIRYYFCACEYDLSTVIGSGRRKNDFGFCGNPEEEMQKLQAIRSIGSWTAQLCYG